MISDPSLQNSVITQQSMLVQNDVFVLVGVFITGYKKVNRSITGYDWRVSAEK